jgi:hypothetical protein
MTITKQEVYDYFLKLKKYHFVYQRANEEQRGKLLDALKNTFIFGETLGIDYSFSETLVTSGKDFVDSLFGQGDQVASDFDAQIIFA